MWFWFALIALLCWSGSDLFSKIGCQDSSDKYSHLKMVMAVGIVMGLHACFEIFVNGVEINMQIIMTYLPVSLLYIISMAMGYIGLRYMELSISSPICNSSGALVAIATIAMSGIGDVTIGDTICAAGVVEPLPFVKISAPTMEMTFSVNNSPFAGREGKFVTSRQIRDRLYRETLKDVSLRVTDVEGSTDSFNVAGRGEMSLSILIETMRREGYEFQVSPPRVLMQRDEKGNLMEPMEELVADVPQEYVGSVIEKLGTRKAELKEMTPVGARMRLIFLVPSRGLFGYRNEFLTDTHGEGIMASVFDSYAPYKGDLSRRNTGSLVSFETGESITYGLFNAQERGQLFIGAGVPVYAGMVVGVSPKQEDITVNVCKKKQLTNTRAAGSDDALRLVPPRKLSLEQCLEFLADDELLEVTPKSLRIRKRILDHERRMKAAHGKGAK